MNENELVRLTDEYRRKKAVYSPNTDLEKNYLNALRTRIVFLKKSSVSAI